MIFLLEAWSTQDKGLQHFTSLHFGSYFCVQVVTAMFFGILLHVLLNFCFTLYLEKNKENGKNQIFHTIKINRDICRL